MTFMIEPGLALAKTKPGSDRAGSKAPEAGSGDAFARSLEADRGTQENKGDGPASTEVKASDAEPAPKAISSPLDGSIDAEIETEGALSANSGEPPSETVTEAITRDEAELLATDERHAGSASTEASDPSEDDDNIRVAGAAAGPVEASKLPADAELSSSGKSSGGERESVDTADNRQDKISSLKDTPADPEIQAMTVQATAPSDVSQSALRTSGKDTRLNISTAVKDTAAAASDVAASQTMAATEGQKSEHPSSNADLVEQKDAFLTDLANVSPEETSETVKSATSTHAAPSPDAGSPILAAALGASPASQPAAQPAQSQIQMTPTNAIVTASPAETVKIITDAVSSPDDTPDRITVQLDPPELGRVSIDFKFDAHGIQHITVTGESPEALRQLRLMHFELTQALERSGLSGQNMTFQQQQSGHQQSHTPASGRLFNNGNTAAEPGLLTSVNLTADSIRPARTASGGLDIRL
ncbi:flagellar hook-length control protein FliK [Hyphomonas sp.]|uniref:flagellar hook-length control protein FliK n=1 Tax=Hyphomonas sp. TaxID=87 RepID=UPI00352867BC